jgi:hypothetical protein
LSKGVIYSGIDWSEAVQEPDRVFAIVHVESQDLLILDRELAGVRKRIRRPDDYPFKHVDAKPHVRREFFPVISRIPTLQAFVLTCEKTYRNRQFEGIRIAKGDFHTWHGIMALVAACPGELLTDQIMLIDLPRGEMPIVTAYRTGLRKGLKIARKPAIRDLRPRPDDRLDGAIVQVADMIAGEVRQYGGLNGPHLPALASRIHII